jgi:hypothetical protein
MDAGATTLMKNQQIPTKVALLRKSLGLPYEPVFASRM